MHTKRVVNNLSSKGAIFVKELDQIPEGAVTVFGATWRFKKVEDTANVRNLPQNSQMQHVRLLQRFIKKVKDTQGTDLR